jgi:hypothetical protein
LLIEVSRLNRAERLCRTDYEHARDKLRQLVPAELGGVRRAVSLTTAKVLVIQSISQGLSRLKRLFFLFLPPIEQVKQSHNGQNKNANDQPCCVRQQYGHRSSGSVKMVPGQGDTKVCYEVRLLCPSHSTSSARFVPKSRRRFENSGQLKRVKGP